MRRKIIYLLGALAFTGCIKMPDNEEMVKEQITGNVKSVFGTTFDSEHDWCTTSSGEIAVNKIPSNIKKIKLFTHIREEDGETSILSLNESDINGESEVKLVYDAPANNLGGKRQEPEQ